MGAYYTKEDITEYIGKNTILPYLFDEVQRHYPEAFKPEEELWQKLKSSEDLYIYKAVKHGINPEDIWHDLPNDVRAGLDPEQENLVELRRCWNRPAPADAALPTEIWREVITRRQRYIELRSHIDNGDITSINDFITYNLDIRQFTLDLLNETNNTQLVYQFYKALKTITILDPTCGSGAFLFAAMNILEDLYEVCLIRIHEFDIENPGRISKDIKNDLEIIKSSKHPNLQYYIYKSIILNNLYGVDIMPEAVEIAKLRLFLKLVACVDPDPHHLNYGLEPLPDIDFNIRCGNTLVGYANWDEIIMDIESDAITAAENREELPILCDKVAMAYERYKQIQLLGYDDFANFSQARALLHGQLQELTDRLDSMLHQHSSSIPFDKWKVTHQPFHWVAEFYEIIHGRKGFDVIIGNPPYIEIEKVVYSLSVYATKSCGNLYAIVIERSHKLLSSIGKFGMIVPSSATSTDGYIPLQKLLLLCGNVYISSYSDQRGKLFDIPHPRLCIILYDNCNITKILTTQYCKLGRGIMRERLFDLIHYIDATSLCTEGLFPRIGDKIEYGIHNKIHRDPLSLFSYTKSGYPVFYTRKLSWYFQILSFVPSIHNKQGVLRQPSELKTLFLSDKNSAYRLFCALNSTLFYWFVTTGSDCRNLNQREINNFPLSINSQSLADLDSLSMKLEKDIIDNSEIRDMVFPKVGLLSIQCTFPKKSKAIIDCIDAILANHYGFTLVELDYVINYDIKYRMDNSIENEDR